jgi:phosphocarrier protein
MQTRKLVVRNEHGMHARVALAVAQKAKDYAAQVTICKGCEKADGCSVLELLLLGASRGVELEVTVCGKDEEKALAELSQIFEEGSGI